MKRRELLTKRNGHMGRICLYLIIMVCLGCSAAPEKEKSEDRAIPFDFPDLKAPEFPGKIFPVTDFGAVASDTIHMNTAAIPSAIDACHKAGGGKVLILSGVWLTGAIHLKNNVNLHLEKGVELRFSQIFEDYLPVVLVQRGGVSCYTYSPFIYANQRENVAITGEGVLNGRGQVWWPWKNKQPGMVRLFEMGKQGTPIEERVFGTVEDGVRPPFIQFLVCRNILVEGITMKDGPSWNLHPVFCSDMIIRGVKIIAHGPNNDGIDPDGCRNVLIEDCFVDVGDDNICLKSGRDEEARRIGRPCENIVIRRCTTKSGHGGFVIGSEMSAGIKNVLVEDFRFFGTDRGLRFKSRVGRGGIVENIWVPRLVVFKPERSCGTGVIICPGGGYQTLNIENARFISERLNAEGVTTFVIVYRLPSSEIMLNPSIALLQDVQEAFRLVRSRAAEWRLQAGKIGLWGSSAGGHLAAMGATHYPTAFEKDKPTAGLRPDFLILAWPVVTFREPYVQGSVYYLLGPDPTMEQLAFYSPEEHITKDTPPAFQVHASNDLIVPAYNSILFYLKMFRAGVPSELHIYESDKHGFGIAPDVKDSWMSQLFVRMKNQNLLKH